MPSHTLEPIPCLNGVPGPVDPISHSASIVFSAGRVSGPVDSLSHSASVVFSAGHIPESEHQSRCTMPLGHSLHQFSNPHYHHYNTEVYRISPSISTQEPIITLSQWCSKPSRSHQPFGFGSVSAGHVPESETPKPLYYLCLLDTPVSNFLTPHYNFPVNFHTTAYTLSQILNGVSGPVDPLSHSASVVFSAGPVPESETPKPLYYASLTPPAPTSFPTRTTTTMTP